MAKGDVYILIDKRDNDIVAKIEIEDDYCTGTCYNAHSWYKPGTDIEGADYNFFCKFYSKWDSCTHWWFKGEDYDEAISKDQDSYYHICGSPCFENYIRNMCFVWKVSAMVLLDLERHSSTYLQREITDGYFNEKINSLIKLMLADYKIIKKEANKDGTR